MECMIMDEKSGQYVKSGVVVYVSAAKSGVVVDTATPFLPNIAAHNCSGS